MNEIPVYLFTGFMDSGKTTLVKETLFDDGFTEGGRSVVICCEAVSYTHLTLPTNSLV